LIVQTDKIDFRFNIHIYPMPICVVSKYGRRLSGHPVHALNTA